MFLLVIKGKAEIQNQESENLLNFRDKKAFGEVFYQ